VIPSLLLLATILSGECGPLGPQCEVAVARTVVARVESDAFPADVAAVLGGYHGRGGPTATGLALAHLVVSGELEAGPFLYTYSEMDRLRRRWRVGDEHICAAGLCQHFSGTWPGR